MYNGVFIVLFYTAFQQIPTFSLHRPLASYPGLHAQLLSLAFCTASNKAGRGSLGMRLIDLHTDEAETVIEKGH